MRTYRLLRSTSRYECDVCVGYLTSNRSTFESHFQRKRHLKNIGSRVELKRTGAKRKRRGFGSDSDTNPRPRKRRKRKKKRAREEDEDFDYDLKEFGGGPALDSVLFGGEGFLSDFVR